MACYATGILIQFKKMKTILLSPGPTNVPEPVRKALLDINIFHREKEFSEILLFINETLVDILGVRETHSAILFGSSGTGCNEAIISSIHGKILLLNNGKYSQRLGEIADRYNIPVIDYKIQPYQPFNLQEIEQILKTDADITHILLVHHETATGVLAPLEQIGSLSKKYNKVLAVDAISSLGGHHLKLKEWDVDFCTVSANKCIESFPGISFVIGKNDELQKLKGKSRTYYFDLYEQWSKESQGETPFTLPVQIIVATKEALVQLKKEGIENRIERYRNMFNKMKLGLEQIGFKVVPLPEEMQSNIVITIEMPANMDYWQVHDLLKEKGITIYTPNEMLNARQFSIATMGSLEDGDIDCFLSELKAIKEKCKF